MKGVRARATLNTLFGEENKQGVKVSLNVLGVNGVPPFYGASSPKRRLHRLRVLWGGRIAATDDDR